MVTNALPLVRIIAPSRLHLGFYGIAQYKERIYGGIGLSVDYPYYDIIVKTVNTGSVVVKGADSEEERLVNRVIADLKEHYGEPHYCKGLKIFIKSKIPRHVGLGSTTQIALSLGVGVLKLCYNVEIDEVAVAKLALILGRRNFSCIGLGSFLYGGFIADTGVKLTANYSLAPSSIMFRLRFPGSWRIVAVLPPSSWRVIEDDREESMLIKASMSMEKDYDSELTRLTFRCIVPSIVEEDFESFTECLDELQYITGKAFSAFQHGVFSTRESEYVARVLRSIGGKGVGQSSWGPLVYSFFDNRFTAWSAYKLLSTKLGREYKILLLKPRNHGALILDG